MGLLAALGLDSPQRAEGGGADSARPRSSSAPPRMVVDPPEAERQAQELARNKQAETAAFAKVGTDFDTFKDAAATKLSEAELKAMNVAVTAILERVEVRKHAIVARGGTPNLDELAEEFAHIPRNFMPLQFKKELQDWRAVRDAMRDRNVRKMFEGDDAIGKAESAADAFSTVVSLGEGANSAIEKVFDPQKAKLAGKVLSDLGFAAEGLSATVGAVKGLKGMAQAEGPVQHKMSSDETLESLKSLAGTGMDIATEFVPVVGAVKDGAACLANLKECYEHYKLQAETGQLKDEAALDVVSQLARAFGQEQGRQSDLKAKSGVDAVGNAVSATGKALTATGVAAKVGAPMLVVAKGISIGNTVYFKAVDWSAAEKAQKVLMEARAGNEAAMLEVFSHHAAYAKMLIALYAKNKNPLAIKYFVQRGLKEEDLDHRATSMDILMEFGLKQSSEEEAPKTFGQTLADSLDKASRAAAAIGAGVKSLLAKVGALHETPPEQLAATTPDVGIHRVYTPEQIAAMGRTLDECQRKRKSVEKAGGQVPAYVLRNIESLEAALTGVRDDTKAAYTKLMQTKVKLSDIRARWASEADEIGRGRAKPTLPSLDPTRLLPVVDRQLQALQPQIDEALSAYQAVSEALPG
jgi:hypothetical protein